MKKLVASLALIALILLLCLPVGCSDSASALTPVDDWGRPIRIEAAPQRIVSLGPSITEILFALNLDENVVGVTDYCDYPAEATSLPKVGAPFPGFDIEGILDLEPDLVFSVEGNVVGLLEDKITTVVLQPRDLQGIYRDIELVGQLTGTEKSAEALVSGMKQRVEAVVAKTSTITDKPTLFYEVDASMDENSPWTVGHGTFQDDLINLAGATNIARDGKGWYEFNIEGILDADPDIILLEDFQFGVTPESVASRSAWANLTAVKEGRILAIQNPDLTCRQGPRMVDGLEMLARLIHPELFE